MSAVDGSPPFHHQDQEYNLMDFYITAGDSKMIGRTENPAQVYAPHAANPLEYDSSPPSSFQYASSSPPLELSPPSSPSAMTFHLPDLQSTPSAGTYAPHPTAPGLASPLNLRSSGPSPPLPEYRPLPPMSPRTILTTLDNIANTGPKKKSHARKQPAGHIPRPRNAFILFRCLFVSKQSVPASVEKDHRNISRIAGRVWKAMSDEAKEPWTKAAEIEKNRHEQKWPGYRYNPIQMAQAQARKNGLGMIAGGSRITGALDSPYTLDERERVGRSLVRDGHGYDSQYRIKHAMESQSHQIHLSHLNSPFAPQPIPHANLQGLQLHTPMARVGSVPPPSRDDMGQSDMMPPPSAVQFTHPFQIGVSATPTPASYNRFSTPPNEFPYDNSIPPDSPITSFMGSAFSASRIPIRRSSSCPPLPPLGMANFPFNNGESWNAPVVFPTNFTTDSSFEEDSSAMFRNPFTSASPFIPSQVSYTSTEAQQPLDELRPLTAPQHHIFAPRPPHFDTGLKLTRRRGSSLDRALASSSIGHAFNFFGTSSSRASQTWGNAWTSDVYVQPQREQQRPFSVESSQKPFSNSNNPYFQTPSDQFCSDPSLSSSETGTPGLSPSPPASFEENVEVHAASHYARSSPEEDNNRTRYSPVKGESDSAVALGAGTLAVNPSNDSSIIPSRKFSARLFGSQGARLGLDLALDAPLSLDVSFMQEESSSSPTSPYSALDYRNEHSGPLSSSSGGDDSPSIPYTPASNGDFTYSYGNQLMDMCTSGTDYARTCSNEESSRPATPIHASRH